MSAFTPHPQDSANRSARAAETGWCLSIVLHLAAYAGLLVLGMYGTGARPAASFAVRTNEPADDPTIHDARQHVHEILHVQRELRTVEVKAQTAYERWHQAHARNAVSDLQKAVHAAAEAQAQALREEANAEAARQAVEQASQELVGAQTPQRASQALSRMEHAAAELAGAQERGQRAQARASQANAEGAASLDFAEGTPGAITESIRQSFTAAGQAQAQATSADNQTGQALAALDAQVRSLRAGLTARVTTTGQAGSAEQRALNAQRAEAQALQALQQIQNAANAAHAQANYLTAQSVHTGAASDQQAAQQAQQRSAALAAQAAKAQARWQAMKVQTQAAQANVLRTKQATAQQETDWRQRRLVTTQKMSQQVAMAQSAAKQALQLAQQQQLRLDQAVQQLPAANRAPAEETRSGHHEGGTLEGGPAGAPGGAPGPEGGPTNLDSQDLTRLYATATSAERANLETFRQIQAHSAAMGQGISLERALQATDATPPVRPWLGNPETSAFALVSEPAAMSAEQRVEARQQIAAMAALARQMLARTRRPSSEPRGADVAPAALQTSVAPTAHRLALAMEEEGHPAKDLTVVAGLGIGNTSSKGQGHNNRTWSKLALGDAHYVPNPPASPPIAIQAVPGRVVGRSTVGGRWMFIDSWHTIGPFPNPQRANINKPFPPEAGVDLDAAYTGKDDRIVRWKWLQSSTPMLVPNDPEEYAIYYGYTELWFDESADLWIAIGSDDKSTLWIEDQLVWVSSDVLKGWRIDEGLRKVHFKKGVNRVLFRLENGWRGVGISVCLCLPSSPR